MFFCVEKYIVVNANCCLVLVGVETEAVILHREFGLSVRWNFVFNHSRLLSSIGFG